MYNKAVYINHMEPLFYWNCLLLHKIHNLRRMDDLFQIIYCKIYSIVISLIATDTHKGYRYECGLYTAGTPR